MQDASTIQNAFAMADTLQEFEMPDAANKAAQALETYQQKTDDLVGEKLTLNMGPSHPATHGVLRLILELDGEIISKADPDVGYLHRGDEKIEGAVEVEMRLPNMTRLNDGFYRVDFIVGIGYEDDIEAAKVLIQKLSGIRPESFGNHCVPVGEIRNNQLTTERTVVAVATKADLLSTLFVIKPKKNRPSKPPVKTVKIIQ